MEKGKSNVLRYFIVKLFSYQWLFWFFFPLRRLSLENISCLWARLFFLPLNSKPEAWPDMSNQCQTNVWTNVPRSERSAEGLLFRFISEPPGFCSVGAQVWAGLDWRRFPLVIHKYKVKKKKEKKEKERWGD